MSDTDTAPNRSWFPFPVRWLVVPAVGAVGLAVMLARHWGWF